MSVLKEYISHLVAIKQSGMAVEETSYYGPLEMFLNGIGKDLKPSIRAIIHTKNIGAGIPDGGFFSKDQFNNDKEGIKDFVGTLPSRGAIEVKSTFENIDKISSSDQVKKYLRYGQVLVTNYFQFQLVVQDEKGNPKNLERYNLANNSTEFWANALRSDDIIKEHEERLVQYLKRVMLNPAPLTEPKDVAWFLASYARDARVRIEQLYLPALEELRSALEESLGISFSGEKGEHFFRSTLIQTIFYGVFSAWVLFNKDSNSKGKTFDWRLAEWYLKVPMIKALFEKIVDPTKVDSLGLVEVLDWTANVLNRVKTDTFFRKFNENEAVLYFYEPFLEAFDSKLRKDLGVWYTPKEVVHFMVEKVDKALREELNIPRGLADERVYVLDPCCGTGAYLVEVLNRIHKTLKEEGSDALVGEDIKEAAMKRIFGFEIMPAPFVVAHLQLGVLLQNLGAIFHANNHERPGVYLTNALTGWTETKGEKQITTFPELQEEKDASKQVKREKPILVIIGNPPYNAFAGVSPKEEGKLVEPYKEGLISKWGIKKFNLDELYVRFIRVAERKITASGRGIICYVSSYTYTFKDSFVVLREKLYKNFSSIWIDSLNGDSRETGKRTPEGKGDPSIFSTKYNRAGIKVGASISLFVKKEEIKENADVFFREFWGVNKKKDLLNSLVNNKANPYFTRNPTEGNMFSFRYEYASENNYNEWLRLDKISRLDPLQGLDEDRKFDLISFDADSLKEKMSKYFNSAVSLEELKLYFSGLTKDSSRFVANKARIKLLNSHKFSVQNIRSYVFRAFDNRFCYYAVERPLWKEPRPELGNQAFDGNSFLLCRKSTSANPEGTPFYFTSHLFARDSIKGHATAIPLKIKINSSSKSYSQLHVDEFEDNISTVVKEYLKYLTIEDSSIIWFHVLAIGYSEEYLKENSQELKLTYPHIPFPSSSDLLIQSANLGKLISDLLDNSKEVIGVTTNLSVLQKNVAVITSDNNIIDDLSLEANWGSKTNQGIMPGKGEYILRDYSVEEYQIFTQSGYDKEKAKALFGDKTYDIFLNKDVYWKNIPSKVWEYHIGGYQVIKKWLSYREKSIIRRPLTKDEVRDITSIARRIAQIILMVDELNNNYQRIKAFQYNWTQIEASGLVEKKEEENAEKLIN